MNVHASPYALVGPRVVERNFSAIPLMPNSKVPGNFVNGEWRPLFNWSRFCDRLPTELEILHWSGWPDAGVGLAATHGINMADIDTINATIIDVIKAILPPSPAIKTGQKGETLFYRADFPARHFDINGERVLDWLGHGSQSVLPPSIHERTGRPYRWIGLEHLQDLSPEYLPIVTPDNMVELVAALERLGYREPVPRQARGDDDSDSPYRRLNNIALSRLDDWIPRLNLARCKRVNGYRAVASWRPSHTGRPLEQRGLNLKIDCKGIKDFHDADRGYTAIDLTKEALACDTATAFERLSGWVGFGENVFSGNNVVEVFNNEDENLEDAAECGAASPNNDWIKLVNVGIVGELSNLILKSSTIPQPGMCAMSALSITGTLGSRQMRTPHKRGQIHLMSILLAGTSAGKADPLHGITRVLDQIGLSKLVCSWPASNAGLYEIADEHPVSIMTVDEFGSTLDLISGKNVPPHVRGLKATFRELYDGIFLRSHHAKSNKGIVCVEPCVGILGVATPGQVYGALSGEDAESGMLNRFLVINGDECPTLEWDTPDLIVSDDLKARLLAIADREAGSGGKNFARWRTGPATLQEGAYCVPWVNKAAQDHWRAYVEDVRAKTLRDATHAYHAGRCGQNALRVATILAIGENSAAPRVSLANVIAGIALADASLATLTGGLAANYKKAPEAALREKILGFVKRCGGVATVRDIKRNYSDGCKSVAELENNILGPLTASRRLISAPYKPATGRPTTGYFTPEGYRKALAGGRIS